MRTLYRLLCCTLAAASAAAQVVVAVDAAAPRVPVNPALYGIFFEEINHAGEGGLYAELVLNRDFEIVNLPTGATWAGNLLRTRDGWQEREDKWRWTKSPATLYILSPTAQEATLQITPSSIHDQEGEGGVGKEGVLTVTANGVTQQVPIRVDETANVPITLVPGGQTITLSLDAGNFRPSDYGVGDTRELSFAIKTLNLKTN